MTTTKTVEVTFTHRGWLGICPVHIGTDSDSRCHLRYAHWAVQLLFYLIGFYFLCKDSLMTLFGFHGYREWDVLYTDEIEPYMITREVEIDEHADE